MDNTSAKNCHLALLTHRFLLSDIDTDTQYPPVMSMHASLPNIPTTPRSQHQLGRRCLEFVGRCWRGALDRGSDRSWRGSIWRVDDIDTGDHGVRFIIRNVDDVAFRQVRLLG